MIDWPAALAQHDRWLRIALFARLGQRQAVDEVMQDVSLAAAALRTPLGDPEGAGAWLYRVAIRQAMLYRRRCGRRQRLLDSYSQSWSNDPPSVPDPLAVLLLEERRKLIRDALLEHSGLSAGAAGNHTPEPWRKALRYLRDYALGGSGDDLRRAVTAAVNRYHFLPARKEDSITNRQIAAAGFRDPARLALELNLGVEFQTDLSRQDRSSPSS